jgi:hypothetical protein
MYARAAAPVDSFRNHALCQNLNSMLCFAPFAQRHAATLIPARGFTHLWSSCHSPRAAGPHSTLCSASCGQDDYSYCRRLILGSSAAAAWAGAHRALNTSFAQDIYIVTTHICDKLVAPVIHSYVALFNCHACHPGKCSESNKLSCLDRCTVQYSTGSPRFPFTSSDACAVRRQCFT